MSTVTATTPHTIPSMVRTLRARLRCRLPQDWASISRSKGLRPRLEAQGRDRVHRGRPAGRVEGRQHRHRAQEREGQHPRLPGRNEAREELGHGQQVDEAAGAVGGGEAEAAAQEDHDQGLQEELADHGPAGGPERPADAISRVRSRTVTSITFITPMPPMNSVATPTAPRKCFIPSVMVRKAFACSTVSRTAAASLSAGSKPWRRAKARLTSAWQASWSSTWRGVTMRRSTESGRAGGLFGKSRRTVAKGTKTFWTSSPS